RPTIIGRHQLFVGKPSLRIPIQHPHVAVRRRAIGIEINLLYIFAVRSLRTGYAEEALLQKRIATVPEREGKTKPLFEIRDAADAVFTPAKSAGPRLIVRKIIP